MNEKVCAREKARRWVSAPERNSPAVSYNEILAAAQVAPITPPASRLLAPNRLQVRDDGVTGDTLAAGDGAEDGMERAGPERPGRSATLTG